MFLMITGAMLAGFGTVETDTANLLVRFGAVLLGIGVLLWLLWLRPWKHYDDLKTAYYTGHHHDDHSAHGEEAHEHHHTETPAPSATLVSEGASLFTAHTEVLAEAMQTPVSVIEAMAEAAAGEVAASTSPDVSEAVETPVVATEVPEIVAETSSAITNAEPQSIQETPSERQNLRVIEGVGAKTQEALYAEGITTYQQIANLTPQELEEIVKVKHGVRIISGVTESWPKQAQFLANGDEAGLKAYQEALKGGRIVE
jgi:predicted flap endonuclease-1-like 5' DNA nuclease